ncbi:MAG: hypothetical protein H6722_34155 [Sandaracinus sp.]|nr:hypothetical protein [Sandaracinus sp.]MCB9617504.1 hypothetical protein [Sandaracinus sp.]MCB9620295.1 hypothetical protein [Sandaracinus sp.]
MRLRLFAFASLGLLGAMVLISFRTGVAQEPFELAASLETYRAALARDGEVLARILALDALFIPAYLGFFFELASRYRRNADATLLRFGLAAMIATGVLDVIEDQMLFAAIRAPEALTEASPHLQHVLSQAKFHVSAIGLVLFGASLPMRTALERAFAVSLIVPVPLVSVVVWLVDDTTADTLYFLRWLGYLAGFTSALWLHGRGHGAVRGAPA